MYMYLEVSLDQWFDPSFIAVADDAAIFTYQNNVDNDNENT